MSTTSSPAAASPTSAPPSPTPSYNANASTLLFGFLVSALSIFAVFMSLAIVWNRLIARRHAIEAMLAMTPPPESPRLRRPRLRDIWIMPDKQPQPWLVVNPVAAEKSGRAADTSRSTQTERSVPFWRRHLWNRLPPEITYLFYRPIPLVPTASQDTNVSQTDLLHGSDIQVSLLIAMPRAPESTRRRTYKNRQSFHEIVFATTVVSYYDPTSL